MSYCFELDGETLWQPALRVGECYVELVVGRSDALGVPHGLTTRQDDTCDIDPIPFRGFVGALLESYERTPNFIYHALSRGLLLTSLVLVDRLGLVVSPRSETGVALCQELPTFARSM